MQKNLTSIIMVLAGFMLAVQAGAGSPPAASYQALTLEDCLALARKENPVLAAFPGKDPGVGGGLPGGPVQFFPRLTLLSYYTRQPADRFVSGGQPHPTCLPRSNTGG